MASYDVAYEWLLDNEDNGRQYKTVLDTKAVKKDTSGNPVKDPAGQLVYIQTYAISGINSGTYLNDFSRINAIRPEANRAASVKAFYQKNFWSSNFALLTSDEVAKRVFDAGVNMGQVTAVKMLQFAINLLGNDITADGGLGPNTVAAANACDPDKLVEQFKALREDHYRDIVKKNPLTQQYLTGWLARAGK